PSSDREPIDCDGVPYSPHVSPRSVRNRGRRPRGYSTFGNRGAHKSICGRQQNQAPGMDYTGDSQAGPAQPLYPVQDSLVQTSVPVTPGTHLLRFLFNLYSSLYVRDWALSGNNICYHLL